ncbi:class I SAM-dependent methyltransferase [Anabaena sp. UHCC 0451]|uniref:class I SAM-dependent methyltransferase n=1 Tax=Anabaena sp. UHCC 0451 TaxID=2055235 RepID=UPI002B1F611C|nr:methyltransferase domain-containing protein [Anabaena sp. UHCC 0451]MEA5575977.1 methyltransferase domain-containing protein [Anabaena sp. UHCC 0451]
MPQNLVYLNYWQRKELLKSGNPKFPLLRWWISSELCEVEKKIFTQVKDQDTLLDVGAGDLKIMQKLQKAGYSGQYHTQDIGEEFEYHYANIEAINEQYSAILCLDVIEHLQLSEGLTLIHKLVNLLKPEGVIILQTPNGRCIRSPLISDMTHLHCYNLPDLWAYLTSIGLQVEGYRVVFEAENKTWLQMIIELGKRYIITRFFGLDYADNIVVIARKTNII